MASVFFLTLRQLSGKWRLLVLAVLASLPVIVAILSVNQPVDTPTVQEFERAVLSAMLAGSITPLVVLAIGSVAFASELEDRTLANLTLSPIPRWQIVLPKLLATICVARAVHCVNAFYTGYVAFSADVTAWAAAAAAAVIGVVLDSRRLFGWG